MERCRRLPVGAERWPEGGVHFRVWAPRVRRVEVILEGGREGSAAFMLEPEGEGYFSGVVRAADSGTLYRYRLEGREPLLAPPEEMRWELLWSSEDPRYGGGGTPSAETRGGSWRIPGQAAVVLSPQRWSRRSHE